MDYLLGIFRTYWKGFDGAEGETLTKLYNPRGYKLYTKFKIY